MKLYGESACNLRIKMKLTVPALYIVMCGLNTVCGLNWASYDHLQRSRASLRNFPMKSFVTYFDFFVSNVTLATDTYLQILKQILLLQLNSCKRVTSIFLVCRSETLDPLSVVPQPFANFFLQYTRTMPVQYEYY